jgi:hypothetical protein
VAASAQPQTVSQPVVGAQPSPAHKPITGTQPTPDAQQPPASPASAPASAPAGAETPPEVPTDPGFLERGGLRRRLRLLRKTRELAYRDLGGLVFEMHRLGHQREDLVRGKLATLGRIDTELRAIEGALRERRSVTVLREAGVTACPRCAAIHGSEDRFCPACGFSMGREERPIAAGPVAAPVSTTAPAPATAPTPAPARPNPSPLAPPAAVPRPQAAPAPAAVPLRPAPVPAAQPPSPARSPGDVDQPTEIVEPPTQIVRPGDPPAEQSKRA